jgi:glycerate-2-kinase
MRSQERLETYLDTHDSHSFFAALGNAITTGTTGIDFQLLSASVIITIIIIASS